MEKSKKIMIVTISIMSLILACVIFMQFKVVSETDIAQIETMRKDELEKAIAEWKEKYEIAYKKLADTNSKINEYEEKMQSNTETKELINKELSEAKTNFGLTDVEGEGIIITLTDTDVASYDAEDILELVNDLREAGAEAISINGERIINTTSITCDGNVILINGNKISSPFEIRAIGSQEALLGAIQRPGGYLEELENCGLVASIEKKEDITIYKYNGVINYTKIED